MSDPAALYRFITESNRIEGIHRPPLVVELDAHRTVLSAPVIDLDVISTFVRDVAGAELRNRPGMDVRVGNHVAPLGGLAIAGNLGNLLFRARQIGADPFAIHREYLNLHPFMDGNGRSSRVLWLRMMGGPERVPLGFLHTFYYQTLSDGDRS